uniref:Putative secreted peptide n=1 Tax=Anopheles braziliensis TaxID=58242 RepID=A0A2M3ZNE3_9DIPT
MMSSAATIRLALGCAVPIRVLVRAVVVPTAGWRNTIRCASAMPGLPVTQPSSATAWRKDHVMPANRIPAERTPSVRCGTDGRCASACRTTRVTHGRAANRSVTSTRTVRRTNRA